MELKRFYAEDMSHGIRTVKKEMGPEAVILGSNRINDRLEILAASDYDEELYEELTGQFSRGNRLPSWKDEIPRAASDSSSGLNDVANLEFRQELVELQNSLRSELAQLSEYRKKAAKAVEATPLQVAERRLERIGLSRDVGRAIAKRIPKDRKSNPSWQDVFGVLRSMLSVGNNEILEQGGIIAVVGSTGVGKTTTVAKLAARYAFRHGKDKVALITTDTFRIGGQEQLESFGRALGVPVSTAANAKELSLRIREYGRYDLVLIDTAGISQRDIRLASHLQSISAGSNSIKSYLVISSTSELALTQEVIEAFHQIPLTGAIITKIDEAASLGPVLSGVIRHRLPVSYLCDGQDIPGDIATADRKELLRITRRLIESGRNRRKTTARLQAGA